MVGGVSGLLLASVAGYWVLERSEHRKGNMKLLGQVLGAAIIIVSLAGTACKVWCLAGSGGTCSIGAPGASGMCPFSGKGPGSGGHGHGMEMLKQP